MQTQAILENIYTVSQLNADARQLLEQNFPFVWVEGEISNFVVPHSGHWYFSLKDASAQVRCAMFKLHQRPITFLPKNGQHILIKARVSLYENRGEFQLIVEALEERGEGKLRRAFEQLKAKLEAEGLFEQAIKKKIPLFPKQLGVITSSTGAAIHDILNVLSRRYPLLPVIIYPTAVQGVNAPLQIVQAITLANERQECDVLIVARGGGSLEDLWSFNDEQVARAIYGSSLPIISGIGHEIDFTIADFVADVRAPTPSAAAEIATPDSADLIALLKKQENIMTRLIKQKLKNVSDQLTWMYKHINQQHPKRILTDKMQRLDFYESHLVQLALRMIQMLKLKVQNYDYQIHKLDPCYTIRHLSNQLKGFEQNIIHAMQKSLFVYRNRLTKISAELNTLSPLATLERGYAIASASSKQIIRSIKNVTINEEIEIRLHDGLVQCKTISIKAKL